jgi:hypothetical protein
VAFGISEASDAGLIDDDITKQAGNSNAAIGRVYKRGGRAERSHSKRQELRRKESAKDVNVT